MFYLGRQTLKKLAAILLLVILLFNWVGYRFVINYMDESLDRKLEARLDIGHYNEEDLVEIKVPISLPYQVNWNDFERFNGEIEIDGIHYKYVKRKVHNDSLVLLCLKNEEKMEIQDAKSRFFALVNDLNTTKPSPNSEKKHTNFFKSLISECLTTLPAFEIKPAGTQQLDYPNLENLRLLASSTLAPDRPPSGFAHS